MKFFFPLKGKHAGFGVSIQPPFSSPRLNNVRPYDVLENRARGGQRPGLTKWGAGTQVGAAEQPVVAMCIVSSVE